MRRNSWMEFRLNWDANLRALRKNRGGERGSSDGEMERFRLFRFQSLQFFLLAIFARDLAERCSVWLRIRVQTPRRIL